MSGRHDRQQVLPEIGAEGQTRIAAAHVTVIGAGGLGCPVLLYLTAAGVGRLRILDADTVARSNLHRQVLYTEADLGKPKALAAAERLNALDPALLIEPRLTRFTPATAEAAFAGTDLVLECSDSIAAKYLANDLAVATGRPLIIASALGLEGQMLVRRGAGDPCWRCLWPQPPAGPLPNCAEAGVLGPLVGMIGTMQAVEALKLLADPAGTRLQPATGRMLLVDARAGLEVQSLSLAPRPDCPACGPGAQDWRHLHPPEPSLLDLADAAAVAALAPALILDLRRPAEQQASGILPGALCHPAERILAGDLPPALTETAGPVLLYCAAGGRSRAVAEALARTRPGLGLAHLSRGLQDWDGALIPVPPAADP